MYEMQSYDRVIQQNMHACKLGLGPVIFHTCIPIKDILFYDLLPFHLKDCRQLQIYRVRMFGLISNISFFSRTHSFRTYTCLRGCIAAVYMPHAPVRTVTVYTNAYTTRRQMQTKSAIWLQLYNRFQATQSQYRVADSAFHSLQL